MALRDSIQKQGLAAGCVGGLEFGTDTAVPALQAADVIAWATRRNRSDLPFKEWHMPLKGLFDDCYIDSTMPDAVAKEMSESFAKMEEALKRET